MDEFDQFFNFGASSSDRDNDDTIGRSLNFDIELDFLEAVKGTSKSIEVEVEQKCSECKGSRSKAGTTPTKCSECGGRGFAMNSFGV
jgi:molecular chaperone DnaJ